MKRAETVILDVDGTLVDSNDIHMEAWHEAFARFGKEIDRGVIRSNLGKGGDLLVPDLLAAREMQRFGKELQSYRKKLFQERYLDKVRPFDDVREALQQLRSQGRTLILASSADEREVEYYFNLVGLEDIVSGSTSSADADYSKPFPEIFEAALERAGGKVESSIVVGDTPYDILAAHRLGIIAVAVASGGFAPETLAKAELQFRNVPEMVERIDEVDALFRE